LGQLWRSDSRGPCGTARLGRQLDGVRLGWRIVIASEG